MRRFTLPLLLCLSVPASVAVPASVVEEEPVEPHLAPWYGYTSPVIAPERSYYLGFGVTNTGDEVLDGEDFWGGSGYLLAGPDGGVQRCSGEAFLAAAEYVRDVEPGGARTAVVDLAALFDFSPPGRYRLRWRNDYGSFDHYLESLDLPAYLLHRLRYDVTHNHWRLYLYGEDGLIHRDSLAALAVEHAAEIAPELEALLDDDDRVFIEGSEEATIGAVYAHRVCDYAAIILSEHFGYTIPELREIDPGVRDSGIIELRRRLIEERY